MSGWGSASWGGSAWGDGEVDGLALLSATPIRENVVRLEFNAAVFFNGLLSPKDGSNAEKYAVTPVAGTAGDDGLPARPVTAVLVERAVFEMAAGRFLDVSVDRPFSPRPARYSVAASRLFTADGLPLFAGMNIAEFDGLRRGLPAPLAPLVLGRTDLASPVRSDPADPDLVALAVDESGDYAADAGPEAFRKRVTRRIMSRRDGFAFLVGYGVGTPDLVKRLARDSTRARLAAEAENQVKLEPETKDARARVEQVAPGVFRLRLEVLTRSGESVSVVAPLASG